tara:strand:- start:1246 stop:2034 length:789 start_codon:yes stop_codon:yes gene_type:complete
MHQFTAMAKLVPRTSDASSVAETWAGRRVGITGAGGALGRALTRRLRQRGAWVIALSHRPKPRELDSSVGPQEWVCWSCGKEDELDSTLSRLDVLVLNHGINPGGDQSPKSLNQALEVNALSQWRLLQRFEQLERDLKQPAQPPELWVNTSEAEIQPALSPAYELSKRLIGQLVSLRWSAPREERNKLPKLRKLVLGPFRSELNPIGLMSADFVSSQILWQADLGLPLIIVTPNPLTLLAMPLIELGRLAYNKILWINHHDL